MLTKYSYKLYFLFSILGLLQVDAPFFSSNSLPQHLDRGVHRKAPTDFVNDLIIRASATRKTCSQL